MKAKSIKEMVKMSIIKNPSVKVALPLEAIYESLQLQPTVASNGTQMAVSNNAIWTTNTTVSSVSVGTGSTLSNDYLTEKDLGRDAFNIPVERLVDLWCAKFGNTWVNLVDLEDDIFFVHAYKRLKALGELEVHYLTDRACYVCRVPE